MNSSKRLVAVIAAVVLVSGVTEAATIAVTNLNSTGTGSLRDAINSAASGDTIDCTGVSGTIILTNAQLSIVSKNLTIKGPGAKVLGVSGNTSNRVFNLSFALVTLSGLTIANGAAAGAQGGGILNDHSTVTLSNCAVNGNTAQNGGGIYNNGAGSSATLTLINCTISSNAAGSIGGAIVNAGSAGNATLAITNCTLSGNSGSVGGIYNDGENTGNAILKVFSSTFSSNAGGFGGAIYNEAFGGTGTIEFGNNLFKAPTGGENLGNDSGTYTSRGYNLSSDAAGGDGTQSPGGLMNATGDQRNTNPMLDPAGLRDNGGKTLTIALLPGSPAVDKGNSFGLTTDQRGVSRPYNVAGVTNAPGGNASDIGAFELIQPALSISRSNNSVTVSWPSVSAGFVLQQSSDLRNTNSWTVYGGSINDDGTTKSTTFSPPTGNSFLRLKGQ